MQGRPKAKGWRLPAPAIGAYVAAAVRKVLDDPSAIAVVLKAVARGASWLPRPAAGRHGLPTGGAYRPGNCSNAALYPWTGQAQKRVVGIE